jgi:SRSO17 transposase
MTEHIVKRWPRFDNFVALFEAKLSKPAQRHFIAMLIAFIIYAGRKNIAGLNQALFAPCHTSSLSRFIGEADWDAQALEQIRQTELNRRVRRFLDSHQAKQQKVNAFLCIDDTNNPKSGTKTAWASYQYSHLAGGLIRCYCLVTALMVVGPYSIPLAFQLYRKETECQQVNARAGIEGHKVSYLSKTAMAVRLVQHWQIPQGCQPFVLADSWYICDELLAACKARNITLIGGLKANRLVRTTTCPKLTALSAYAPTLPKEAYQHVTLAKHSFRVAGVAAQLKGGQAVKLVIGRELAKGVNPKAGIKQYSYHYFMCSDATLSVGTICEFYSVRWEIETFHACAKELLGLDHNQCWRERNVSRMWTLLLIAYSYLMLEQVEHPEDYVKNQAAVRVSLGQVVAWHKREAHCGQAEWVYRQALAGVSLDQLLAQIAA